MGGALARFILGRMGKGPVVLEERRLVIEHGSGQGCSGVLVLLWLSAWCYGLVWMFRQTSARRPLDWQEIPPLVVVTVIAVAMGMYVLWAFVGRDTLRVEGGTVRYTRWAGVRIRHKRMRVAGVRRVELVTASAGWSGGRQPAIEIEGEGRKIRFGMGKMQEELLPWTRMIRERIEKESGRSLGKSTELEQMEAEEKQQQERAVQGVLAVAGAESMEQLPKDPRELQKIVVKAVEREQKEKRAKDWEDKSKGQKVGEGAGCLLTPVFVGMGLMWIFGTVGLTVRMVQERRWGMEFMLAIFQVVSVFFAFVIYASVVEFFKWIGTGMRKLMGR